MTRSTGTPATRQALTAAVQRCHRIGTAYRTATDATAKADLFTAAADAAAAHRAAYLDHHGRPPAA